jgi:predicted kinase
VHIASTLIVMRGYPGTGKSTVAKAIATTLRAAFIDRDIIRQTIVNTQEHIPDAAIGRLAYELMFALARAQLNVGLSVVIDSPLTYYTTYEQAQRLAHECHVPMLVVHCQCAENIQRRRLEERKSQVFDFQITSWEEWQQWKPRFELFEDGGCILDTSRPLDDSLAHVMEALQALHMNKV